MGTHLYCRAWLDGGSEPGTWGVSGTDSSISAAGGFGVSTNSLSSGSTWDFDSFTVTDSSLTAAVKVRALIRTLSTKTVKVRALIRTISTKTLQVRAVIFVGNQASKTVKIRVLIRTISTKTVRIRSVISTINTKTVAMRALIRTQMTKTVAVRSVIRTVNTKTVRIRAFLVTGNSKTIKARALIRTQMTKTVAVRSVLRSVITKTVRIRSRIRTQVTKTVQVRAIVVTPGILNGGFAIFSNGSGTAQFDSFRVTEYPDPSLSLGPIFPRIGTSIASWNAITPLNTTLGMDISFDGINWIDITSSNGGPFPTIFNQVSPVIDTFSSDSHLNYNNTNKSGGSTATWAYDTSNSRIIASGGSNAIYSYSLINRLDVDFFVDIDQSDAGGVVWRFSDPNDFYYVTICDSLSSIGTKNTITLFKVSSNVQTMISSVSIAITIGQNTFGFIRGTFHRFRVTMLSNVITVYIDGNQVITYADTSPLVTGTIGLFNNGGTSRYYQLWMVQAGDYVSGKPMGDTVTGEFVYTRSRLSTSDPSVSPQVKDITTTAVTPEISMGVLIPSIQYILSFCNVNFDDLAKQSNYSWYIDQYKHFFFNGLYEVAAPWILQSNIAGLVIANDIEVNSDLELDVSNDLYKNYQSIIGAVDTFTPPALIFLGDGTTTSFTVGYPIASAPAITLNGIQQTVGLKGTTGYQFYYAYDDAVIQQDVNSKILDDSDKLIISYTGLFDTNISVSDLDEQSRVQSIEGGSGIVESVEDQTGKGMTKQSAINRAEQFISRYAIAGRTLIFDTSRDGLQLGQVLTIFFPEHGIFEGQFLINQIEIKLQKGTNDTQIWWYKVTCSELPHEDSWAKIIASGLNIQ